MQFPGKLSEAEIKEASRFIRPRGYALRMVLSYFRLILYSAVVLVILFQSFVRHQPIAPQVVIIRVLILVVIGGFSFYRYRKGTREAVATLDASLPDVLTLAASGVQLDGPNGAHGFQPWVNYAGFREGEHIVLLQRKHKGLYNVVPISALDSSEREGLRGLLSNHLEPLAKAKASLTQAPLLQARTTRDSEER